MVHYKLKPYNIRLAHFPAVIVVTVLFFRSKNQDDLDKKTNNHLPLPLDYASNEGKRDVFVCVGLR